MIHRLLNEGEKVEEGDEFLTSDKLWVPAENWRNDISPLVKYKQIFRRIWEPIRLSELSTMNEAFCAGRRVGKGDRAIIETHDLITDEEAKWMEESEKKVSGGSESGVSGGKTAQDIEFLASHSPASRLTHLLLCREPIAQLLSQYKMRCPSCGVSELISPEEARSFMPNDLDSMYEAEKMLRKDQQQDYLYQLQLINKGENFDNIYWNICHASAEQRAKALENVLLAESSSAASLGPTP